MSKKFGSKEAMKFLADIGLQAYPWEITNEVLTGCRVAAKWNDFTSEDRRPFLRDAFLLAVEVQRLAKRTDHVAFTARMVQLVDDLVSDICIVYPDEDPAHLHKVIAQWISSQ